MKKPLNIYIALLVCLCLIAISLRIDIPADHTNIPIPGTEIPVFSTASPIDRTDTAKEITDIPSVSTATPIHGTDTPIDLTDTPTDVYPDGNSYYVSTTGDDNNLGTETTPWRTISHGVTQITAGDTLYIRGGTYQEMVIIDVDGTEFNPILISGFPGEEVVIDGKGNTLPEHGSGAYLVRIEGDYVTFSNATVQDFRRAWDRSIWKP